MVTYWAGKEQLRKVYSIRTECLVVVLLSTRGLVMVMGAIMHSRRCHHQGGAAAYYVPRRRDPAEPHGSQLQIQGSNCRRFSSTEYSNYQYRYSNTLVVNEYWQL
jgi:hypothetical protein